MPQTLKCIIIDDEPHGIEALRGLIGIFCPNLKVVATANHISEALLQIRYHKPDVVFLDIEMPGGNGFELLDHMDDISFEIIFVTAYQQYAIKAIRYAALEYLLKPVNPDELKEAVVRVMKKQANSNERYPLLKEHLGAPNPFNKIVLPGQDAYNCIAIADIVYCEADNSYTVFYLSNGKAYIVSKNLKEYEALLQPHHFFRIHKSYLVNLAHIEKINKADACTVILTGDKTLPVSYRRREAFFEQLRSFA